MVSNGELLVSVVTPVYNGEKYLSECIESVLAQTHESWEYVIVNNCSTDRSLEIAQSYAEKDDRIRIYENNEFLPAIANHNKALRQISAESKYCKVVHADDWLFPECISQMVRVAEENPSVGIVSSYMLQGTRVVCDRLPCPGVSGGLQYPITVLSGREICRFGLLTPGPSVFGSPTTILIRSDLIRNRETFYKESYPYADRIACYELLQECDFGFVHQVLSFMREHAEQQTSLMGNMNPWIACRLYEMKKYGPIYLSREESEKLIKERLRHYYKYLGRNVYPRGVYWRHRRFWDYHRSQLEKIGCPLSSVGIMGAFGMELLDVLLNPKQTFERIVRKSIRILKRTNHK